MPSLQSIALLALVGTVTAYTFEDEFSGHELVARDAGNLFDSVDELMEIYERDVDSPYLEGQVLVRSAKGASKPSSSSGGGKKPSSGGGGGKSTAGKILKGVGKGASAFGDVGTGLTGIANVVGMFQGQGQGGGNGQAAPPPPSKRDLEELYEDAELFVREAARYGSSRYHPSDFSYGPSHEVGYTSYLSDGIQKDKRDLEDLDDDFGLFTREANGRRRHGGSSLGHTASVLSHGISHGNNAIGSLADGINGISNVAGLFQSNIGSGNSAASNSKRDLEDLLDDAFEIYARELGIEDLEY